MTEILLIGLGASLGAALRWILTLTWKKWGRSGWPIATLFINLTGSFLIGWLSNIAMTDSLRLFLTTGLLGGYTTFSTFNTELLGIHADQRTGWAGICLAGNVRIKYILYSFYLRFFCWFKQKVGSVFCFCP